jgi:hypothetical protein
MSISLFTTESEQRVELLRHSRSRATRTGDPCVPFHSDRSADCHVEDAAFDATAFGDQSAEKRSAVEVTFEIHVEGRSASRIGSAKGRVVGRRDFGGGTQR